MIGNVDGKRMYTSKRTPDGRPYMTVGIKNNNGVFQNTKILVDTGNDLTLLTKQDAIRVGLNPASIKNGKSVYVQGINENVAPAEFKTIKTSLKFGDMVLNNVRVAVATKDEDLPESLLGRQDVMDSGLLTFVIDNDSVDVVAKCGHRFCNMRE